MCDGMIMTPAILAPMKPSFPRQARTVRASTEIESITSSAMSVKKRNKKVRGFNHTTSCYAQPMYNAVIGNFERALTDIT